MHPEIVDGAREGRALLGRTVRHLIGEIGVRQFLELGSGLPTADITHEVAQSVAPDAPFVYADNDPLVLARALLTSTLEGRTRYLHADMRDRDTLTEGATEILDLTQPVAVLFISVLGHVTDTDEARGLVHGVRDRMPSGSYLVLADAAHATDDDGRLRRAQEEYADTGAVPYRTRTPEELAGFFDGLEWVDPGLVSVPLWRPDPAQIGEPRRDDTNLGGIARKP